MDPLLRKEMTDLINEQQNQDSIELGNAKGRIKVYVNFGKEQESREKIETAIKLLKEKKEEVL